MNKKIASLTLAVTALFATTAFANPTHSETHSEKGPMCRNPIYSDYGHTHGYNKGESYSENHGENDNHGYNKGESYSESYGENDAYNYGIEESHFVVKKNWQSSKDEFTVGLRYFAPKMKGGIKSNSIHNGTGRVDFKNDLNLSNGTPTDILFGYKNMSLEWMHLHEGGTSSQTVTFNDKVYDAGTDTKNNFDYVKFNVSNPLAKTKSVEANWTYGLNVMRFDANVSNKTLGEEGKTITVPLPTLGVGATYKISDRFGVYTGISGLPLGGHGNMFDWESGVKYNSNQVQVGAGWRVINISAKSGDDEAKYRLSGPFAEVTFLF